MEQLAYSPRFADDLSDVVNFSRPGPEHRVFANQTEPLRTPPDRMQQFLRLNRFGQVIDSPGFERFDCSLGRVVSRDHQDRQFGAILAKAQKELVAVESPEVYVGDDHKK
jgi:hypothetical protein